MLSCSQPRPLSELLVRSAAEGQYEVYKVDSEFPFQFTSETIGTFNKKLELNPGKYLILADCSSKTLTLKPRELTKLVTHQIIFNPPSSPNRNDQFSIQCDRYSETQSRQSHKKKFELNILPGSRDLLVGMVPFTLQSDKMNDHKTPHVISYDISSIMVESFKSMKPGTRYFISPDNGLIAVTAEQHFGHKQYLLPGTYTVEVNGTRNTFKLAPREEKVISPAFLRVSAHKDANLHLSSQIQGKPLYAELNQEHHIDINETYPVMPGKATIRLSNSREIISTYLTEKQLTEEHIRSLIVNSDCSPWDWTCIGRTTVFLFPDKKAYPTVKGVTDVPMLFFTRSAWISLQGTKDVKRMVHKDKQHSSFDIGQAHFMPKQIHRNNLMTDLVRIESIGAQSKGQSLDLNLKNKDIFPLITGNYHLGQYASSLNTEHNRFKKVKVFTITKNHITQVPYNVYSPDAKKTKSLSRPQKNHGTSHRHLSTRQIISGQFF